MSPSEIHAAAKRTVAARLAIKSEDNIRPNIRNLEEFLLHGIQYAFIPEKGELSKGMPTVYAANPLESLILSDNDPPPVWPHLEGRVRSESFLLLHKSAPCAARE